MYFLKPLWTGTLQVLEWANTHGFPIPLLILLIVVYVFERSRIHWDSRQTYYLDILKQLGTWKNSLSDRLGYYQEPGSEYRTEHLKTEHYKSLMEKSGNAFQNVRESLHISRLFLATSSLDALDRLISEHWVIAEHGAISDEDYVSSTYVEVEKAYEQLLKDARADLKKGRYAQLFKSLNLTK